MKILYIAKERREAEVAATALGGIAQNVTVSWASQIDHAESWIHENRDLAALVVDAQVDMQRCASFLKGMRSLGLRAAVVLIVPEEAALRLESLPPGGFDYIAKNESLIRNLPGVVTRAIERASLEPSPADGRQATLEALVYQERATRASLEKKLAEASAALEETEQRHRSAMKTAADQLAERQAQHEASLVRAAATWDMVDEQLREAAVEVKRARQNQAAAEAKVGEAMARERLAAEQAAERQAAFQTQLGQEVERRQHIEEHLLRAEQASLDAEERFASAMTAAAARLAELQAQFDTESTKARDLDAALDRARRDQESHAAAIERLTRREAELASELADAATTRHALECRLAGTETAFKEADERATRERLAATKKAAEREAALNEQRAHVEGALRDEEQRHALATTTAAAEVERLTRRDVELAAQLADAAAARHALERQLTDAAAALKGLDERATRERLAAARKAAEREAELDGLIHQERVMRADVEQKLTAAHETLERQRTDTEGRFSQEVNRREALESRLAEMQGQTRDLSLERDAVRESLGEARRHLEEARRHFQQTRDRDSSEHADALATLVASVAERDARIEGQVAQHAASLAARHREIEQLQHSLKATVQELDLARSRRDVLQAEADRVPQLQKQLEESRAELARHWDHSPLALCRCTRGGALMRGNRAFASLVDYGKGRALRGTDFATSVFESPDDLSCLIERCLSTQAIESIETTWRGLNGGRLAVRLSAFASAPDVIEIVAEDLSNLRALQERLRQAYRMEAVGRLASEVAVTCGNLLLDVHQNAQRWLTTVAGDTDLRRQGDTLLDELTRAAGFLQQLAAYSDEEASALAPVDLNRVLRDLEPVLKRVAGDDVELELPKTSVSIEVDVKAEHVERLLINLAGYGRARMPLGGRLRIELATVVVDHGFVAKYPNVRQGPHALITVTEAKRTRRMDGLLHLRNWPIKSGSGSVASQRPGVDLGALQALIRECSGHLWMAVEPPGDMVVKMHLPMRVPGDPAHPRTSVVRTRLGHTAATGQH